VVGPGNRVNGGGMMRPRLAMNVVPVFTHLAGLFMLTLEAV